MGNEIAKGDAKYLDDPETFVEKYQKITSFSANDLLKLRLVFAANALNDTISKRNYLSLLKFKYCMADIGNHDKLSLSSKLMSAEKELVEQYYKILFLILSKKVSGKGYAINNFDNMEERRLYLDDFITGMHIFIKGDSKRNHIALTQYIFNTICVDDNKYLTKEDLKAYCMRNHSYIVSCRDFIVERSLISAKKMVEKLGRQVDEALDKRLQKSVEKKVDAIIQSMKGQYEQVVESVFTHFDQAKDKKIHYQEYFGVISATPHLLGLLNPIKTPAEMLKMACSGNPGEVTHVYKETHYAVKHSEKLKKNFRRMSVRPVDLPEIEDLEVEGEADENDSS